MKQLKKDLQAVSKELKALAKKTEKMMKAVQKLDKAQATKKPKAKAKAKTARKPAAKKARAVTATDEVLKLIKRTKKGIDAPSLIKKTGFDERKVRNILFRAFKQGKIKRAGRGNYVAA
ncbi:MAG: hypothetical protein SWE60_23970 [Thermodesulfobacteriota bacterium]|nr:hypothetical protein [Thermodesulfobacteriota bacterium]